VRRKRSYVTRNVRSAPRGPENVFALKPRKTCRYYTEPPRSRRVARTLFSTRRISTHCDLSVWSRTILIRFIIIFIFAASRHLLKPNVCVRNASRNSFRRRISISETPGKTLARQSDIDRVFYLKEGSFTDRTPVFDLTFETIRLRKNNVFSNFSRVRVFALNRRL